MYWSYTIDSYITAIYNDLEQLETKCSEAAVTLLSGAITAVINEDSSHRVWHPPMPAWAGYTGIQVKMIWAALAPKQKGSRACPWEAPPEQHVGVFRSLQPRVLVGNTHKNAILFTGSVGPVIFFTNHALSPQEKYRCLNVPFPTNTRILAISVFLTRCGLAVFLAPFLPPGSVPTVCFSLSYSLQQPPRDWPSPWSVCPWATEPHNTALLHSGEDASSAARQTELSCLPWVFHRGHGRDWRKRQPGPENHGPVSQFVLESLCSAVHSGMSQPA